MNIIQDLEILNHRTNYYELFKGEEDEINNNLEIIKSIKNGRKFIDDYNFEYEEKLMDYFTLDTIAVNMIRIQTNNKYASDFILELPYNGEKINIYKDLLCSIKYRIGGYHNTNETSVLNLSFYNWLFDKYIEIKNNYVYIPLSFNINIFNSSRFVNSSFCLQIHVMPKYLEYYNTLDKNNKKINIYCREYDINENDEKEFKSKLKSENNSYTEKFIQNQSICRTVSVARDQYFTLNTYFEHSVFCLYVYGFNKNDISEFQLIFNNYVFDMVLKNISIKDNLIPEEKECLENIYILEFADPLLFDTIFSEPMTNTDIFNKKTINFSNIQNQGLRFKKMTDKTFSFHMVALNYNYHKLENNELKMLIL